MREAKPPSLDAGRRGSRLPWPLGKLYVAATGLLYATRNDLAVAYKIPLSLVAIGASIALRRWIDLVVVVVATGTALSAELLNSALERLCDFVESRHDERIGRIKDMAAAGAGVSILAWAAVLTYEYLQLAFLLVR